MCSRLPVIKTFTQALPATNDYQNHRVEIKIDALPVGDYGLIACTNNFSIDDGLLAIQQVKVTNLSFINNGNDYFVLNRESGQPVVNAIVRIERRAYDSKKREYVYKALPEKRTDKNGHFMYSDSIVAGADRYVRFEFKTDNDSYTPWDDTYYYYRSNENDEEEDGDDAESYEEDNQRIFFFTDRSIYRPGQTVFFKGILVTKDFKSKLSKIIAGYKSKVYLHNANGEKIDSLVVTTNEFGSYNGKFKLPENILTGEFSMEDDESEGEVQFSVEEYKRPKFQVEYEKQKGTYRLYDSITVVGTAEAYAGNSIDGAIVKYRVVRKARFPYPWLLWRRGWFPVKEQEIAHGEAKTDATGKFTFKFIALPDKDIDKKFEPVFDYVVTADVTDISGETRTGETRISVGYKSLLLTVTVPQETMVADSLKQIFIKTTNQAGEFQSSRVNVAIWKLDAPTRLIRERYWPQPDQFVMSKAEYIQYFPHDEYSDETKKENWARLEKVYERSDTTRSDSKYSVLSTKYSPGWYAIEVTTRDKDGNEVKDIKFVQLTSPSAPSVVKQYNWYKGTIMIVKAPGDTASTPVGSSAENVFVIKAQNKRAFNFISLSNEQKSSSVKIADADRGGLSVFYAFVKDNRFYTTTYFVDVPWTNKQLNISYETYRDKTLPGSEEKWKVKLTGYNNEKVAAELLTSMYDASLDQFKEHNWSIPSIWPSKINQTSWNANQDFPGGKCIGKIQQAVLCPSYQPCV